MIHQHYIGLNVHKQFVFATRLDAAGQVVKQWRFATTPKALKSFAASLTRDDVLCLESTTNAVAIYRLIRRSAGRAVISDPLQTKAIASAKIKTDKVDSRVLAELLRADYLPAVWIPDSYTIRLRGLTSYRTALMRQRTWIKNRNHAILHRNLVAKPEVSDLFGKKGRAFLEQVKLPADERFQMDQELLLLNVLDAQITDVNKRIAQATTDSPQMRLRQRKAHNKAVCAVARKLVVLIWQMLTKDQPYSWAPPLRTHEKIRHIEIMAGKPKKKSGPKQGQPSQGGRRACLEQRKADHDMARLAQAQYEELVQLREISV